MITNRVVFLVKMVGDDYGWPNWLVMSDCFSINYIQRLLLRLWRLPDFFSSATIRLIFVADNHSYWIEPWYFWYRCSCTPGCIIKSCWFFDFSSSAIIIFLSVICSKLFFVQISRKLDTPIHFSCSLCEVLISSQTERQCQLVMTLSSKQLLHEVRLYKSQKLRATCQ